MKMPKAKNKNARPEREEESEDEYEAASQSLTQAERQIRNMSSTDIDRKVNELVQYLLIVDQKKLPIKRLDINKHVLKEHAKAFPKIIEKVEEKLQKVFSLKLVEVEGKPPRYILVNLVENEHEHLMWSEEDITKMGLLAIILSTLFMKGGVIQDGELYSMLKSLGVDVERQHEVFGDVKKLLTQEFVRQLYLEHERVPNSEPPTYNFLWGQRAHHELKRGKCLEMVASVYETTEKAWVSQYEYVRTHEGPIGGEPTENGHVNGENEENEEPQPGPSNSRSSNRSRQERR